MKKKINQTELIDNYLSSIPKKYKYSKRIEKNLLLKLLSLKDI